MRYSNKATGNSITHKFIEHDKKAGHPYPFSITPRI